jgi:NTE family protein
MTMPRTARLLLAALLGFTFVFGMTAYAAPEKTTKAATRPKLGLVLSGGGARGAAHIGVLQVLEEMRVPVDLITGTSMGSVVGGLYAAGLSPKELGDTIQSIDWVKVFDDKTDRQDLSFRRKQDDRTFLTNLRLGFKNWSLFIPSGIVEGQKLDFLLRTMTLDANGLAQIENLPLPFRAVATDIVTGEAVVFDHGPLAVAQRASMSIPAAFSPVVVSDRVLVDGYVANNLPIDVAQELGATAIIAVDISTPASKRDELGTAVGISGQVSTFPVQEQQRRQIERMGPNDVLLQPDLGDIAAASFTQMERAIAIGREAALAAKDELARYSVSEAEYEAWKAKQRRPPLELPVINAIRVENESPVSDRVIRARIKVRPGEPLDLEQLSKDLGRLFGLDAFERVRFDLRRESEGMVLVYQTYARERGTNYFRFGLNLETDLGNESDYNLGLNHVWFPVNKWDGEVRTEAQIGDTMLIGSEYYQPLEPRDWFFVMPFAKYTRSDVDVWQNHDHLARFVVERTLAGLFAGVNLGNFAQLRGGIGYLDGEARRHIGDPDVFRRQRFNGGLYAAELEYDTLDDVRFPNDGSYALVSSLFVREELGFSESYETLNAGATIFRTWRKNTVSLGLKYETSFGAGDRVEALNSLGGFLNLSGFERNSITGKHVGLARLLTYRRVASPAVFAWEFPVYVGGFFEIGNAWEDRSDIENDLLFSAGPFVGVDTPLGPLYLAYAYGEGGEHQGYLYLGQSF